jgi:hypothetical protein
MGQTKVRQRRVDGLRRVLGVGNAELQRGRWPREALQWVVEGPYESELWRSVMTARLTLGWGAWGDKKGVVEAVDVEERRGKVERGSWKWGVLDPVSKGVPEGGETYVA